MLAGFLLQSAAESEQFDGQDVFRTIFLTWSVQCILNGIITFRIFVRGELMQALWDFVQDSCEQDGDKCWKYFSSERLKRRRIRSIVYAALGWAFNLLFVGIFGFASFGPSAQAQEMASVLCEPFDCTTEVLVVNFIVIFIQDISWVFPIIFYISVCGAIRSWFGDTVKELDHHMQLKKHAGVTKFPANLPQIKAHHSRMCELTAALDSDFKWLAFFSFATNIPLLCFLILEFTRIPIPSSIILPFTMGLWLAGCCFIVVVVCLSGARLQSKALDPIQALFDFPTDDATSNQLTQLNLFVRRLTHGEVGISVGGIFLITTNVLLTILTAVVTYTIVVLELAPEGGGDHMVNATEVPALMMM